MEVYLLTSMELNRSCSERSPFSICNSKRFAHPRAVPPTDASKI